MIAVPLFVLFGPDAIEYRLANSGASAMVTDVANWPKVAEIRDRLPDLRTVVVVDGEGIDGTLDYDSAPLPRPRSDFRTVDTAADDPAIIIYTSGTTGPPKGALHAHRFLLGHLPGVLLPHEFPPRPGDLFWTPADWAWIGGLYDILFPAWHWGLPVLAHAPAQFDPERALDLMARHAVRNAFLPPTALKLVRRSATARPRSSWPAVGRERRRDARRGTARRGAARPSASRSTSSTARPNATSSLPTARGLMEVRPGSMGRPVPGHEVAIIDDEGSRRAAGRGRRRSRSGGRIPVMFLGYWDRPDGDGRQVHRRLVADRRPGRGRRGRLPLVSTAATTTSSRSGALPDRARRGRGLPAPATRRSPWLQSSASPTRSGPRS